MPQARPIPSVDLVTGTPINRIVVPITLDHRFDRGVAVASRLAERWALPIHLVTAPAAYPEIGQGGATPTVEHTVQQLQTSRPDLDVDGETLADAGDPADLVATVLGSPDLAVVATDAAGSDDPAASFGERLVATWGGPVMMVGPEVRVDIADGPVVVGVDGSALAERAVPPAVGLSVGLDVHPWIVQVVPASVTEHVQQLRNQGEHASESGYVRDVTERLGAGRATWEIIHGDDPATSLLRFAEAQHASFLVMATHGQSGLTRQVFGSVCMSVVRRSRQPVVVIRPTTQPPAPLPA